MDSIPFAPKNYKFDYEKASLRVKIYQIENNIILPQYITDIINNEPHIVISALYNVASKLNNITHYENAYVIINADNRNTITDQVLYYLNILGYNPFSHNSIYGFISSLKTIDDLNLVLCHYSPINKQLKKNLLECILHLTNK